MRAASGRPVALRFPNIEVTHVYAIVQARGRQVKVTPGAVIEVDGTPGETGSAFTFDQVLLDYWRRTLVPFTFWLLSALRKLGRTRSISSK